MPPDPEEAGAQSGVERFVMPFIEDSSLWPVLFVFIGHGVALSAPVLLLALRDRRPLGLIGLFFLVGWSVAIVRFDLGRRRARGAFSLILGITWALGAAGAWIAHKYSIF